METMDEHMDESKASAVLVLCSPCDSTTTQSASLLSAITQAIPGELILPLSLL